MEHIAFPQRSSNVDVFNSAKIGKDAKKKKKTYK